MKPTVRNKQHISKEHETRGHIQKLHCHDQNFLWSSLEIFAGFYQSLKSHLFFTLEMSEPVYFSQ